MGGTVGGSKGVQLEVFGEPQGSAAGCFWWACNLLDFETQVFRHTTDYCYRYANMSCNYSLADLYYKATFYEL